MRTIKLEKATDINSQELDNIASNIEHKIKLLNIKLPKLAELANVDYFTLRKLVNKEDDYMPNLRILIKLATFFNITTGDLINYNKLPQYIPIINIKHINDFLNNDISEFELQDTILCEHYVHEHAFSIKRPLLNFNINTFVHHVCYPTNQFYKDGIFIVELKNQITFIQVHNIKNNKLYFNNGDSKQLIDIDIQYVKPLAMVVKFLLNQNLI